MDINERPPEFCPFCGASTQDTNYGFVEINGHTAHQICICSHCGNSWYEIYDYTGIERIENNDSAESSQASQKKA